ncbi:hypothetical protein [Mycobacterium xenopi]|uniref:Uncharacterized protein n=1 Tax=Mycobacterium xenopi TaxID=1789 RepID=A0AAD1M2M3_MYCXE|nr:hypothetical protein [Mycobacterium xenopi]MDA3639222.1 hypothetical protein [Mycobacterium xenopi]MDA3657594.1 hypothetical protein [Mycobacterium xenopi]MDA3661618.1 hypothetical protein [Mycobacterium xenopi]ORX19856.1 hypothetical protein AWC32_08470 [Mycobacterium xenopi]SPX89256.1 Uncharacterised protein [Mycobacterium xenopi]
MSANWDRARSVADAVLYEGYLLYPYRATSSKNQSRWQFGVLGPPGAAVAGIGEDADMSAQFLVENADAVKLVVRFLQLQHRGAERDIGCGRYQPVDELTTAAGSWLSWDEAVERELCFGPFEFAEPPGSWIVPVTAPAGTDIEAVAGGRLVRTRQQICASLSVGVECDGALDRVTVTLHNTGAPATDKDDAIARSLIGSHIIAEVIGGEFISLLEPPEYAAAAAGRCEQHRCFPVLAGAPGDRDLLLISPIILYDHPEIAEQSRTALYDATEIDEILTLRVMTMTEEEKAQARATDPLAAQIIDRCDAMSPEEMQRLHGVLRQPHQSADATGRRLLPEIPEGVDWWDPLADNAVRPEIDAVLVNGVAVARGSRVRLRPARRADAQDLFFAGKTARVTSVHEDVDGNKHLGVVVDDDPAADLHDWYGRYLYFSPDEVEPLEAQPSE